MAHGTMPSTPVKSISRLGKSLFHHDHVCTPGSYATASKHTEFHLHLGDIIIPTLLTVATFPPCRQVYLRWAMLVTDIGAICAELCRQVYLRWVVLSRLEGQTEGD